MRMVKTEASSGAYVHHQVQSTLDLSGYSWVPLFIKDQVLRKEISDLEAEIIKTQNSLIDKGELRQRFDQQREAIRQEFIELTAASLAQVQERKSNLFDGVVAQQLRLVTLLLLGQEDIDSIFSSLQKGTTQREIDLKVKKLEKRKEEIQEEINKNFSPQSRWFHKLDGSREDFPRGDRWTEFVNSWRETASRYGEAVNYEGERLKTEAEHMAFKLLFFNLQKVTPLREPRD